MTAAVADGVASGFHRRLRAGYTATGAGVPMADGFEVAYVYPDARFINRWALEAAGLKWTITMKDGAGAEAVFAAYELTRTVCAPG
ncbi:MAG: hypothetical protein ACK4OJ_07205 [Brevundimonas sp.]